MAQMNMFSAGAALALLGGILWAAFRVRKWLREKVCHV